MDIMFVNYILFLISISKNPNFITVERIRGRLVEVLHKGLRKSNELYKTSGFIIVSALKDGECDPFKDIVEDFFINFKATKEHVQEVKMVIRVRKEIVHIVFCSHSYKRVPVYMLVDLIKFTVIRLSVFPKHVRIPFRQILYVA